MIVAYVDFKQTMITSEPCPSCGAPLDPGAVFCANCGISLAAQQAAYAAPASAGTCAACGAPLNAGDSFCVVCGAPITGGASGMGQQPQANHMGSFPRHDVTVTVGGPRNTYVPQQQPAQQVPPMHMNYAPPSVTPQVGITADTWDSGSSERSVDDDDPTVRPKLITLTYAEARDGCRKYVTVDGRQVEVHIPAGVDATTKFDVPDLGYFDEMTGKRGPLRLTFFLI